MKINSILPYYPLTQTKNSTTKYKSQNVNNNQYQSTCLPSYNVYFTAEHKSQTIPDIDYFKYKSMTPAAKGILRKKCGRI